MDNCRKPLFIKNYENTQTGTSNNSALPLPQQKKVEVDIVIEQGLKVAGIEIKAVAKSDVKGLSKLRDTIGEQFTAGVVFYDC